MLVLRSQAEASTLGLCQRLDHSPSGLGLKELHNHLFPNNIKIVPSANNLDLVFDFVSSKQNQILDGAHRRQQRHRKSESDQESGCRNDRSGLSFADEFKYSKWHFAKPNMLRFHFIQLVNLVFSSDIPE